MSSPRCLALLTLLSVLGSGCAAAPPASTTGQRLEAAAARIPSVPPPDDDSIVPIEPGERHRYRLDAPADHWLSIELWQREVDLDLRILDSAEREVAAATAPGNWSEEVVDLVTTVEGGYLVEVASGAGRRAGSYRLRVTESRPATSDDPARLPARHQLRELSRRRASGKLDDAAAAEALRGLLAAHTVAWSAAERAMIAQHLGDALFDAGELDDAAAAYRAGLAAISAPARGHLAAELVRAAGRVAQRSGQIEEAEEAFRRAAEIARTAGEQGALGSALNNRALLLQRSSRLDEAIESAAEAAEAKRAAGDTPSELNVRLNLAHLLFQRGARRAAHAEYERIAVLESQAALDDPGLRARLLIGWAMADRASGDVDRAQTSLTEAIEIAVVRGDVRGELLARLHMGALLNQLGDYAEARAALGRAAELADGIDHPNHRPAVSVHLGWAELGAGDATAARVRFARALERDDLRVDLQVQLLYGAATADLALEDHASARLRLARAAELTQETRMSSAAADVHRALGSLHLDSGDLAAAASSLHEAAAKATEIVDPLRQAAVASLLAQLAARRGDPVAALREVLRAIELREEVRSRIVDPSLRASFLARWRGDFELAIEMLMLLSRTSSGDEHLRHAFRLSEAAHARTLTELLLEARVDVRHGVDPALLEAERAAERRLSLIQDELADALTRGSDAERLSDLEEARRGAYRAVETAENDIRRSDPRYADIHRPRPLAVEQVQPLLDERTALLEFFLGQRASVLFVVTRERFEAVRLPAADELADRVANLRELIGRPPLAQGALSALIAELTSLLLTPAAEHLRDVDQLLVVPDRDLFYLPFEALALPNDPTGGPGGALRRWTIVYLPSAAVLEHFATSTTADWESEVLLLADPPARDRLAATDYDGAGSQLLPAEGLAQLPGARYEAQQIAALFQRGADLFVGEGARESLLKARGAVRPARRLHIASHGHIVDDDPSASFVLLAADDEDDGLLQMHEVFNLELAAELVVLSGCETALGQQVEGEGLIGLARAFLYAGARELIVSLRPVPDAATAELMVTLYRHLIAGLAPAEALRRAKLTMLDAGVEPAVWSAFVAFAPPSPRADIHPR